VKKLLIGLAVLGVLALGVVIGYATPTQTYWTKDIWGSSNVTCVTYTFDNSYPTGGESLTPAMLGLLDVDQAIIPPSGGFTFAYDFTNFTIVAYASDDNDTLHNDAAPQVVASSAGLSGVVVKVLAIDLPNI
jgi:hypothetical protein